MDTQQPGLEETCDTVGVLGPIVNLIASLQAAEATKLLAAAPKLCTAASSACDVWTGHFQSVRHSAQSRLSCLRRRQFTYLDGDAQPHITLCGRDSVQITSVNRSLDLATLKRRLSPPSPMSATTNSFSASASRPTK